MAPLFSPNSGKWGPRVRILRCPISTEVRGVVMLIAVYNSGIPDSVLKPMRRIAPAQLVRVLGAVLPFLGMITLSFVTALPLMGADWSGTEQQLARKIVTVTGPGAVALTFENRSSLGRRDSEIVQNGLRAALEQLGLHIVKEDQAAAALTISLSENITSYVWVGQIHQSVAELAVVMVSTPRSGRLSAAHDSMPISLRKTLLWAQSDRILDLAVVEENGTPARIAVLSPENVSFYRWAGGKWQAEQVMPVAHRKPWPLDVRGRLVMTKDHLIDAYLPGMICHPGNGGSQAANCRESDDPWPISQPWMFTGFSAFPSASPSTSIAAIPDLAAFFAPARNFFTGVLTPPVGKFNAVPAFYSAAFVPRDRYALWLFAAIDGKVHMVDGMNDQAFGLDWGSDIASVRTQCGAGWQVLSAGASGSTDSVRAYEFPDRDPVAVSPVTELPGEITSLWTETRGDTAVAIVNDRETGNYEAFRVALACNQ